MMETWVIVNSRDMFIGEYDDREMAYEECRRLNADPDRLSLYHVVPGPTKKSTRA